MFLVETLQDEESIVEQKESLMKFIKGRRIEMCMTQIELAESTKSSQKQISCYEKNLQVPSILRLISICKALDLEIIINKKENQELLKQMIDYKEVL